MMFIAGRRRGDFLDPSNVRTSAQSTPGPRMPPVRSLPLSRDANCLPRQRCARLRSSRSRNATVPLTTTDLHEPKHFFRNSTKRSRHHLPVDLQLSITTNRDVHKWKNHSLLILNEPLLHPVSPPTRAIDDRTYSVARRFGAPEACPRPLRLETYRRVVVTCASFLMGFARYLAHRRTHPSANPHREPEGMPTYTQTTSKRE